jgi:hypothetical protein
MGNVLLFKLTATLQAHGTSLKFSSLGKKRKSWAAERAA